MASLTINIVVVAMGRDCGEYCRHIDIRVVVCVGCHDIHQHQAVGTSGTTSVVSTTLSYKKINIENMSTQTSCCKYVINALRDPGYGDYYDLK